MASYTLLEFSCILQDDTSFQVISVLEYMLGDKTSKDYEGETPAHPFFETSQWNSFLQIGPGMYPAENIRSSLYLDAFRKKYHLFIRCQTKNWENEIETFLDWTAKYSQTGWNEYYTREVWKDGEYDEYTEPGFAFVCYHIETAREHPTLIYFRDGKAYLSSEISPELTLITV